MKILVTGASGFVGGWVIRELEPAHELRLFSRTPPAPDRPFLRTHAHVAGDLRDFAAVRKAVDGMDAVAHLGANPWFSPETFAINAVGTYHVLEACREAGVRRVVIAGSDWGVGKSADRPAPPASVPVDETQPCRPHDHYGLSKVVTETVAEMYAREHGIRCAVLRLTDVWKPEQTAGYAAKDHANAAGECAPYWWSWVDVRDAARAFRLALEAPDLPGYGAYFIAAADTMLDEPTAAAVAAHWPGVPVRRAPSGHAGVFDLGAARRAFGWEPRLTWRDSAAAAMG